MSKIKQVHCWTCGRKQSIKSDSVTIPQCCGSPMQPGPKKALVDLTLEDTKEYPDYAKSAFGPPEQYARDLMAYGSSWEIMKSDRPGFVSLGYPKGGGVVSVYHTQFPIKLAMEILLHYKTLIN